MKSGEALFGSRLLIAGFSAPTVSPGPFAGNTPSCFRVVMWIARRAFKMSLKNARLTKCSSSSTESLEMLFIRWNIHMSILSLIFFMSKILDPSGLRLRSEECQVDKVLELIYREFGDAIHQMEHPHVNPVLDLLHVEDPRSLWIETPFSRRLQLESSLMLQDAPEWVDAHLFPQEDLGSFLGVLLLPFEVILEVVELLASLDQCETLPLLVDDHVGGVLT